MVQRSHTSGVPSPEVPREDDLALPLPWARWAIERLRERGMQLSGARRDGCGWVPCAPDELLPDGLCASIGQRPSCGGVVTTVHVWGASGLAGAFWLERAPGGPESPFFRVVLLQALMRAASEGEGERR